MTKSLHRRLVDLAWQLKDIVCQLDVVKHENALDDAEQDDITSAAAELEKAIDLLAK